jgi:flagellar basal body-associated protein FliL
MKKKLLIALPVLLVVLGGAYKFALAKPAEAPKPKVHGDVYVLPKDFLINLESGRFVRLNLALVLEHGALAEMAAGGGHGAAPEPPEGFGPLPQEALVRDIVTDALTGTAGDELISRAGREKLKKRILKTIAKTTDVHAHDVLFTDVAVQ